MARRKANYRRNENHRIANGIVRQAKGTERGIAMEDLSGIRERTTVRAKERARHSGWAFAQLQGFVVYKAKLAGVPVVLVDAHEHQPDMLRLRPLREGQPEEPRRVRLQALRILRGCRPERRPQRAG